MTEKSDRERERRAKEHTHRRETDRQQRQKRESVWKNKQGKGEREGDLQDQIRHPIDWIVGLLQIPGTSMDFD